MGLETYSTLPARQRQPKYEMPKEDPNESICKYIENHNPKILLMGLWLQNGVRVWEMHGKCMGNAWDACKKYSSSQEGACDTNIFI